MSFAPTKSYALDDIKATTTPATVKHNASFLTASATAGYMILTILLTLSAGRAGAMTSCLILTVAIIYCMASNSAFTVPLLIGYIALEGLFKYMSDFSQVVYVIKPVLELLLSGATLRSNHLHKTSSRNPPFALLTCIFAGWATVEVFHPLGSGLGGAIGQLIVWYVAPMSLLWTIYNTSRSVQSVEAICYTLLTVSVVVSMFAAFQFQMGEAWTISHLGGYAHVNSGDWVITNARGAAVGSSWRPASTGAIGGAGGSWAMWGTAIGMGLLFSKRISLSWKLLILACIGINAYGIVISGCRLFLIVAMIQAIILVLITPVSLRSMVSNLVTVLILVGVIWGGYTAAQSASNGTALTRYSETLADPVGKYAHDRGSLFNRADMSLTMLAQYPFGVGYQRGTDGGNAHDRVSAGYAVNRDDAFNAVAGDMGWPGLIFTLWIFLGVFAKAVATFRLLNSGQIRLLGCILLSIVVGYLICFFGGPVICGGDMFWLFIAMLFVAPVVQQVEARRASANVA